MDSAARFLQLPIIRGRFTEIAAVQREQLSYLGLLAERIMAECDDRDKRRAARRIHDAGFPRDKRIELSGVPEVPSVTAVSVVLAGCLARRRVVAWGPPVTSATSATLRDGCATDRVRRRADVDRDRRRPSACRSGRRVPRSPAGRPSGVPE